MAQRTHDERPQHRPNGRSAREHLSHRLEEAQVWTPRPEQPGESGPGAEAGGAYYRAAQERLQAEGPELRHDADELPAGDRGEAGPPGVEPARRRVREFPTEPPPGMDRREWEKEMDRQNAHHYSYMHQRFADDVPAAAERAEAYRAPLRTSETREEQLRRPAAARRGRIERWRSWAREPFTAEEIMTARPRALLGAQTLDEAARLMRDENCGIVPVVTPEGRLLGVLTDRDLVVRAIAADRAPAATRVEQVMTKEVDAATPGETIHDVIALMGRKQIRRVPVVDRDDRLLGIISMADIATRAQYDVELQHALDQISSRRTFWNRIFGW